jgi:asparagine synthase (glutamine-hydrolysing)
MCGIFGQWNRDSSPIDLGLIERATTSIRHRGPDDEGYLLINTNAGRAVLAAGEDTTPSLGLLHIREFGGEHFDLVFGFRRLAILDLSPAGHQPMAAGGRWLVFNGEIYNYLELRSELASQGHRFRTNSDSEVVLAAFGEWGPQCVERFRGMWSFAIWDSAARSLFLSRDRFGIKPLFLSDNSERLLFASEAKALIAGGHPFEPSTSAVASFIALGRLPSASRGDTFFSGIQSLPPAHSLLATKAGSQKTRYWSLPDSAMSAEKGTRGDIVGEYRSVLMDAMRIHLRADVPIGTCLSGGLDSSSIVALSAKLLREEHPAALERLGRQQQTFSAIYDIPGVWNERRHIDRVLAATDAEGNYVIPTAERLWRELDQLVWHQDEPFATTSMFAQWCVMDLARQRGATVLLDGQGADEVLGGYHSVYSVYLRDFVTAGRLVAATAAALRMRAVAGIPGPALLGREVLRRIKPVAGRLRSRRLAELTKRISAARLAPALGEQLLGSWQDGGLADLQIEQRSVDSLLRFSLDEDPLPHLLRYEDRNSMAYSIEGRVPFLDHRLVEFVFTRGRDFRIRDGWTKWLQRAAIAEDLPPEVTWRRDKVGFATPEADWLKGVSGRLSAAVADSSELDAYASAEGFAGMDQMLSWRWLVVSRWLHVFGRAAASQLHSSALVSPS